MESKLKKAKLVVFISGLLVIFSACGTGKNISLKLKEYKAAVAGLNAGNEWYKKGCYERALESVFKSHELFSLFDNQEGVAKSFNNLGNIYRAKKDTESAVLFFDEAIRIYKMIHDERGMVQAISNKSAVYIDLDRYDEADICLNEAEKLSAKGSFTYPPVLNNRGILLTRSGRHAEAKTVLRKALSVVKKENHFEYSAVNFALGNLMLEMKNYKEAGSYLNKALEMDKKAGFNKGIAGDLFAIGSLYVHSGDPDSALGYLQRSLKIYTLQNDKQNADKVRDLLTQSVNKVDDKSGDTVVTDYFIGLWNNGTRLTVPCE